jgi:hypothetical protein
MTFKGYTIAKILTSRERATPILCWWTMHSDLLSRSVFEIFNDMLFGWDFLFPCRGTPLQRPRARSPHFPHQGAQNLVPKKIGTHGYHMVKIPCLYLVCARLDTRTWQTDGRTESAWLLRTLHNKLLSIRLLAWSDSCLLCARGLNW